MSNEIDRYFPLTASEQAGLLVLVAAEVAPGSHRTDYENAVIYKAKAIVQAGIKEAKKSQ